MRTSCACQFKRACHTHEYCPCASCNSVTGSFLLQAWLNGSTVAVGTKDDKVILLDADTLRVKKTVLLPLSGRQPSSNPHEIVVSG